MKQAILLALTISLILLCGCANSEKYEEMHTSWKTGWLTAPEHQIEAEVTGSDDEKVTKFTLFYTLDTEGETVEVLAPELIADIKAQIDAEAVRLSYDGAMLETGSTLSENLSPLMALPTFVDILREGHLENAWCETENETELLVTEHEMPDGTIMTLWQNADDMTPMYADIRSEDKVEVKIDIKKID